MDSRGSVHQGVEVDLNFHTEGEGEGVEWEEEEAILATDLTVDSKATGESTTFVHAEKYHKLSWHVFVQVPQARVQCCFDDE